MEISEMDIKKEVEMFAEYMNGNKRSKHTIKQYSHFLYHFLKFTGKKPEDIINEDVEHFKQYLSIDRKYAKNSIYIAIKAIQAFFKYKGIDIGNVSVPKRSQQLPKYLNEEETHALIEASRGNIRDYAILHVLAYTGIRVGELCNLKIEDIDFDKGIIHIRSGKGDKDRIVIMEERTGFALNKYLNERNRKKVDFTNVFLSERNRPISPLSVERIVKKYAKISGINKRVTPHVLRHTLATTLLNHGADIRFIQSILGHASVSTTQIYTHLDNESLKKLYEKHKPKF